jgi:hypothetical protein
LSEWTMLDDAALDEKIKLSTGAKADAAQRARARRLFASALETAVGRCRPSTPSARGCCTVPVRGQCRPFQRAGRGLHDTAARQADARRCWKQPSPDSASAALATAIVVADQTFKDVVSARSETRCDHRLTDRAAPMRRSPSCRNFWSRSQRQPEASSRIFLRTLIPVAEWPALMEIRRRVENRQEPHRVAEAAHGRDVSASSIRGLARRSWSRKNTSPGHRAVASGLATACSPSRSAFAACSSARRARACERTRALSLSRRR